MFMLEQIQIQGTIGTVTSALAFIHKYVLDENNWNL